MFPHSSSILLCVISTLVTSYLRPETRDLRPQSQFIKFTDSDSTNIQSHMFREGTVIVVVEGNILKNVLYAYV